MVAALAVPSIALGDDGVVARSVRAKPVKVVAPASVVEGQRYPVTITVTRPQEFKRVELQRVEKDVFGDPTWVSEKRLKPRSKVVTRVVAGAQDRDRWRVILTPPRGRAVKSSVVSTKVWHWYPISEFRSHYETSGIINSDVVSFLMNGQQYNGWRAYGRYRSWEARFTPGRNCRSLRGDFGLQDDSSDGSSATVQISTDNERLAYLSPTLVPGMVDRATIHLKKTYRFSILATDTSPDDLYAAPAIGAGELLCTGFED